MSRLSRDTIVVVATIVGLYVLAAAVRLYAAAQLPFPATEAAAYYAGVAQHVVHGQGLVSDAVWSYATPPLVAPKARCASGRHVAGSASSGTGASWNQRTARP